MTQEHADRVEQTFTHQAVLQLPVPLVHPALLPNLVHPTAFALLGNTGIMGRVTIVLQIPSSF